MADRFLLGYNYSRGNFSLAEEFILFGYNPDFGSVSQLSEPSVPLATYQTRVGTPEAAPPYGTPSSLANRIPTSPTVL